MAYVARIKEEREAATPSRPSLACRVSRKTARRKAFPRTCAPLIEALLAKRSSNRARRATPPQYVGYRSGDMEIGLVPKGHFPGALAFWTVSDIASSVKALDAAGGTVVQEIQDVAYGLLVASVKDPNGSIVGLRQFPKS